MKKAPKEFKPRIKGEKEFLSGIHKAKKTSSHAKFLDAIVTEFYEYKDFVMSNTLSCLLPTNKIYLFRFVYQDKNRTYALPHHTTSMR